MAQPVPSNLLGLEILASEPPETLLLSRGGLARIEPFLPTRVHALLNAQAEVFRAQVVAPVAAADSVEDALRRLKTRSDIVAAISSSSSRLLAEQLPHSAPLGNELARLPEKLAERLRPTNLRWLGRTSALTLEGALSRSALATGRYLTLFRDFLRRLPSVNILHHLTLQEHAEVPAARLAAEGLLMVLVELAEGVHQQDESPVQASETTKGLVNELWNAVYQHERAMLRWIQAMPQHFPYGPALPPSVAQFLSQAHPGEHFIELREEWHAATGHLSNPSKVVQHPAYRAIVALGWPVIPYILQAIERGEPDFWGPALHEITGEEPPLAEGPQPLLERIGEAWLGLARRRGWTTGGDHAG